MPYPGQALTGRWLPPGWLPETAQPAALEASTAALIRTGNLRPNALVVKQAEEFGVSVLLVRSNTMETVEKIEGIYGKTRLGQLSKLRQFEELSASRIDFKKLYQAIGIG